MYEKISNHAYGKPKGNRVKIFTHNFSPTIHKKHPCTAGEFWCSELFTTSDRFLENRLASKMQSGFEGKKSSPKHSCDSHG
jgi:hypothetical protein